MRTVRAIALVVMTYLLAASSASAQRRGRGVYVDVGSLTTIADLNTARTEFLSGGPYFGAGVSWQPIAGDSTLSVLGNLTFVRKELHTPRAGSGTKVDAFFWGIDLDYIYFTHRKLALTLGGGGGAVVLHAWDTTGTSRARLFGRFDLGARYVARPRLQLFLQTFGIVYDLRNFPTTSVLGRYARRQSDVGIGLGVALGL
jgi:hypothetical protein